MCNYRILFAVVLAIATLGSTAFAFEAGKIELTVGTGIAMPDGNFAEYAKSAPQFSFGLGVYLSPNVIIGGEANIRTFAASDDFIEFGRWLTGDWSLESEWSESRLGGYLKLIVGEEGSGFYIKGGLGSQKLIQKVTSDYRADDEEELTGLAASLGVGLQFRVSSGVGVFGDFSYSSFTGEEKAEFSGATQLTGGVALFLGG